jgi:hypothetical protein
LGNFLGGGLAMEEFGLFNGHLVYLRTFSCNLRPFGIFWLFGIFYPVLVIIPEKNLAALIGASINRFHVAKRRKTFFAISISKKNVLKNKLEHSEVKDRQTWKLPNNPLKI